MLACALGDDGPVSHWTLPEHPAVLPPQVIAVPLKIARNPALIGCWPVYSISRLWRSYPRAGGAEWSRVVSL